VDKLAGDATLEESMLDSALQGPDAIRAVIGGVRELYDRQDFNSPAPGATTASSRTTPPRFAASRSGASTWATPTSEDLAAPSRAVSAANGIDPLLR
jgi:hypothetical protein